MGVICLPKFAQTHGQPTIHRYLVLGRFGEPNGGRPWTTPRDLSVGQPDAAGVGYEQETVLLGLQLGSIALSRVGKTSKYSRYVCQRARESS